MNVRKLPLIAAAIAWIAFFGSLLYAGLSRADSTHNCQTPGSCTEGGPSLNNSNTAVGVGIGVGVGVSKSHSEAVSLSGASADSTSINLNSNLAKGGNAAATGGSANAKGGSAYSGGNSQTVNVTNEGDEFKRQAPAGPSLIANATAPCRVAVGIGGSWIAGSAGITGSTLDEGCDAREDARLLFNMGLHDTALMRLCAKPEMAAVIPGCPKETKPAAKEAAYQGGAPLY